MTRFSEQLSAILESVGKIAGSTWRTIEPTSHPLDIVNAFGEDEPEPSLALEDALANAPTPRTARSGCRPRDRHAAPDGRGGERPPHAGRRLSAELHGAYLGRDDDVHAYLRRTEYAGAEGIPIAFKDLVSTKGVETTAGSKILAGYVPVYDATVVDRCARAAVDAGQDEHGRVRDGLLHRELRVRATLNLGPLERARRLLGGSAAASPPGSHRGRSAPTRAARSSSPPLSAASSGCVRRTGRCRDTGSWRSPPASTRSARSRRPSPTAPSSTR